MKTILMCAMAVCAACELSAMPTKEETAKAEPKVKALLAPEFAAIKRGKKTRAEVAEAALKLAATTDTEAAKLLLMKGAFALYVKEGQIEKAVETMNAIESAIADLPPQSVTNMVELALLGLPKANRTRLYQRFDATKKDVAKSTTPSSKNRTTIKSIIDGMIKVPGRDYWLSETELTQGQWESVMGYNLSEHRGAELPAEHVSRDDCDVFLEKLNQTKEVQASQFEFMLPSHVEWAHAAMTGGPGKDGLRLMARVRSVSKGVTSANGNGVTPEVVKEGRSKLKEIHVPANAKSWAGMKEWQGKKLAFDAKAKE